MQYQNRGNRWFKCDFHLHTKASKCFQDKEVTPDQWVDKAIEMGLNCVAITDHNTAAGISDIQEAAKGKNLTVFPAVEITCSDSGIHLLVLFETNKTSNDVEDFLIRCEINRNDFGEQTAFTEKSISDVAKIAEEKNALVIPAHIDGYKGLNELSFNIVEAFYENYVSAVHIAHEVFLDPDVSDFNLVNESYEIKISEEILKKWHKAVKQAQKHQKALLTFSDNPHAHKSSKHGLEGIGYRYTWIKMAETPTLESFRQALLLPESRVKNYFESQDFPYKQPDLWIKSIKVENTRITNQHAPLEIEFNPQLNTIVGGRGSGKSSILKFIRGVFNRISHLNDLGELRNDHESFYKRHDDGRKDKDGVLSKDTVIEIRFMRYDTEYKITALQDTNKQNVKIELLNSEGEWQENNDNGFIDFFEFDHFSQKQIYEIAKKPNALRDIIDNSVNGMNDLKARKEKIRLEFLKKCHEIRLLEQQISPRGQLLTQFNDNVSRMNLYGQQDEFVWTTI